MTTGTRSVAIAVGTRATGMGGSSGVGALIGAGIKPGGGRV